MSMQIYVMTVPSGYCKIGIADDPEARRRALQTGHHETITLLGSKIVVDDRFTVKDLERKMHSLLAHKRVRGEWFKFDGDEELANVLTEAIQRLEHPELFNANTCPCCGQLVRLTPDQRDFEIKRGGDPYNTDDEPIMVPKSLAEAYGESIFQGHKVKAIEPIPTSKFDRNAYQRELMRKRRAAIKADKLEKGET
jgi:hypothetical protein